MIKTIPPPRAPLAVRRTTEIPRARTEQPRPQSFDLSSGAPEGSAPDSGWGTARMTARAAATASVAPAVETDGVQPAAAGLRLLAVVIDLVILAGVDAIVIYFTLQICGISWDEIAILPKGPLIAFLIVQNGGYLAAFTAGGQTLGKMIAGIRVVPNESNESLDLGTAITRTAVWLLLAIPAGLGFLTVLGGDHRGLHDRAAGTRVVRASV